MRRILLFESNEMNVPSESATECCSAIERNRGLFRDIPPFLASSLAWVGQFEAAAAQEVGQAKGPETGYGS